MPKKKTKQPRTKKTRVALVTKEVPVVIVVAALLSASSLALLTFASSSNPSVLGTSTLMAKGSDDSSGSDSSGSDSPNSGSGSSDSSDSDDSIISNFGSSSGSSDDSPDPTASPIKLVSPSSSPAPGTRIRTESKATETKEEIKFSETERIRTRSKDGRSRVELTSGGVKVRLEYRDDRVVVKAQHEDGSEVELSDDTIFKIDERLAENQIRVATASADRFVLQRGNSGAVTQFPLSIDLATNSLLINTPSGQRPVTVLPDQAVNNLMAANVVSRLGAQAVVAATTNGEISNISQVITLGEQNGVPVYEINGVLDQSLLGLIPVQIEKELIVSAETGEVLTEKVSLLDKVLDFLSF